MAVDATDGRARARAGFFSRAKLGPPYLALWSSAVLENGLTREYLNAANIDLSNGDGAGTVGRRECQRPREKGEEKEMLGMEMRENERWRKEIIPEIGVDRRLHVIFLASNISIRRQRRAKWVSRDFPRIRRTGCFAESESSRRDVFVFYAIAAQVGECKRATVEYGAVSPADRRLNLSNRTLRIGRTPPSFCPSYAWR